MAGNKNEFVQLGGVLCGITLVVALCLGAVNAITVDPIAKQNQLKTENALAQVMDADSEPIEVAEGTTVTTASGTAVEIVSAYKMTKDGQDAGYCVEVAPSGFGGGVDTMVGISADGVVTGISVISASSETPGLGANCMNEEFQSQYKDQPADGTLAVTKDGGSIVSITGATITSRAVTEGVNAAVAFIAELG